MDQAMRRHHEIVHGAVAEQGGSRPPDQGEGDAVFAAFSSPVAAVSAVARMQRELHAEPWPTSRPLQVRIGVHLGEVRARDGNLFGDPVNRCARIRGLASGGQTLLSAAVFELVRDRLPAAVGVQDLGEHRMKDLTRPERVYQLDVESLPREFPPLLSLNRAKHNLPVQLSSFVGREAEVAEVRKLLEAHRLVTITGFGGMGKTRLALQVAAELADGAGDGVWFVDLAAVTDPARVPAEVAAVLSISETAAGAAEDVSRGVADKNLLLVLDNVEQVLDCAPFIGQLLAAAPEVHMLVTSREPLRVRGERQYSVEPMPLPEAGATPEEVAGSEAVQLFLDRAVAVRSDFSVTSANAATLAAVCARLDGLPLALELAAARMKMLTVDSLLQRLTAGQQLLTGGTRDMPERHRTLRATIAWSVDALTDDERQLLTAMSIVPAPASFDLIEAVAGPELDTFTLLDSLVEKSLVRTVDADGDTRYGLLVSIRDYAAETLTEDRRRSYQDRHANWLAHTLSDLAADTWTDQGARAHLLFVVQELEQLRTALAFRQVEGPAAAEVTLAVLLAADPILGLGLNNEVLDISQHALAVAERPNDRIALHCARMEASSRLTGAWSQQDRSALLREMQRCTDPVFSGRALISAMASSRTEGELISAVEELDATLPLIADPSWSRFLTAERHNMVAKLLRFADPPRAELAGREMLIEGSHEEVGRLRLAIMLLDAGRGAEALEVAQALADVGRYFVSDSWWRPWAMAIRADAARAVGDLDRALTLAVEAFSDEIDAQIAPLNTAPVLADVHRTRGELTEALSVLDRTTEHMPDGLSDAAASILWRRSVVARRLGLAEPTGGDALEVAIEALTAAGPLFGVTDLLACAVERAVRVADSDPAHAARLLGWVAANRRDWVLPFGMDEEIGPLTAELLPAYQNEYDLGASADHLPAAHYAD
jgi:predicted ATPase